MATSETMQLFEQTFQKTHDWLKELQEIGSFEDEAQAYSAMRSVLHVLRDRLTVDEAAHLGAELPMLIRGIYYEGFKPSAMPKKRRTKQEFLDAVASVYRIPPRFEPEQACTAVFELLSRKVNEGEVQDVREMMPQEVREMWP